MSTTFWCAACDRRYVVPVKLVGKRVRCKGCGHVQHVVDPANPPSQASVYALGPEPSLPPLPLSQPLRAELTAPARGVRPRRLAILEQTQVQGLAVGLLFLSAGDLFMTFLLLRKNPAFFESNPVAQWFFTRWNMMGMTLFKFAVIGFAITLSEMIERRRPGLGQFVLLIGCIGSLYAIYKGYTLYAGAEPPEPPPLD